MVRLAGDALDQCRRRVQQAILGHRGRTGDPPSTPPTGRCTPAPTCSPTKQRQRLQALFTADEHVGVEATWAYQRMISAYRQPDRTRGHDLMRRLIESVSHGVPAALSEIITLVRTPKRPAAYSTAPPSTPPEPSRPPRTPARLRPRVRTSPTHRPITLEPAAPTPTTPRL